MVYMILIIIQNSKTSNRLIEIIGQNSSKYELIAVENHSSLGLQRFINSKPQIVLLEAKTVFMNINTYIGLMEKYKEDFIVLLCNSNSNTTNITYNKHIIETIDLAQISDNDFLQILDQSTRKISNQQKKYIYPESQHVTFFKKQPSPKELTEFFYDYFASYKWQEFWIIHGIFKNISPEIFTVENALKTSINEEDLVFFNISDIEFLIIAYPKAFISESSLQKQIIGLIDYTLEEANMFYYTISYASSRNMLASKFIQSSKLLDYIYFEPNFPHVTENDIVKRKESVLCEQIQAIIACLGKAIIRQNFKSVEEYVETLYFSLIKSSLDFNLLNCTREQLDILYDFIRFIINKDEITKSIDWNFKGISDESEYLKDVFGEIIDKIPTNIANMKEMLFDALYYTFINHSDPDIILSDVAKTVKRSPSYLSSLFSLLTNMSFVDFLNQVRIGQAKKQMVKKEKKIKDISESVGIYDQRYFSNLFKKHVGVTPTEYRKSLHE